MNANKRQRAGTSGAPATSGSSSVLGNQGVPLSSLSPREGPRRRVDGLGIGGSSEVRFTRNFVLTALFAILMMALESRRSEVLMRRMSRVLYIYRG